MKLILAAATVFTFTLGLYTLPVSSAPVKKPAKNPVTTAKTPNNFQQWCEQKAKLPQQTRYTVEVLLKTAGTTNCTQAHQKLIKERKFNNLQF
jgi:internalin A